ncbi:MAG: ribosomal protein [Patescibacteria group bacterium]|nr:ribosomal protein [Patescibacteria group bacterium]
MKIEIYNIDGKKVEDVEVSDSVFGLPENDELLHQVYVALSANQRQVLAHTKTRGERAGSGIKPWRQKGTGRARVGSVRTPVWRKGGIVFGPRNDRNFKQKINKKMNEKAILLALSGKLKDGQIKIVDKFDFSEKKTKTVVKVITNLEMKGRTLMAFSEGEKELRIASRNIKTVKNILTSQLNVLDILDNKSLLFTKESVKYLEEKYGQRK